MLPPPFDPVFDSVLELVSGIIAVLISLQAARARSFSKERVFLAFEVSFALLGASSILRGILVLLVSLTAGPLVLARPFSSVADLLQAIIAALAYGILLWVQIRDSLAGTTILPQVGFLLLIPSINILNVFMVTIMTVLIFVRFLRDRNENQGLVALGFFLLACAHLSDILGYGYPFLLTLENVFIVGYGNPFLLALENVLRLSGYICLLAMLLRVRRGA